MTLMNRVTGKTMSDKANLVQSIDNIISTPLGTRVTVRDFGSRLPYILDKPVTAGMITDCFVAIADALRKWEPRFSLLTLNINLSQLTSGIVYLTLTGIYKPLGCVIRLENVLLNFPVAA